MFMRSQLCKIRPLTGRSMIAAKATFGEPFVEGCELISYRVGADKTSVRADSSASRGRAEHIEAKVRLMLEPFTQAKIGDRLELLSREGEILKIDEIFPRYGAFGEIDHYQVDLSVDK